MNALLDDECDLVVDSRGEPVEVMENCCDMIQR